MTNAPAFNPFIQFPGGAKLSIGFLGLFHTSVASLAIGFAFVVTVLQIIAYRKRHNPYDVLARRIQLFHVCVYNIGTINAIGLVFALSGLYPQFWSQIFTQFFWTIIVEELLFFMLATTITLHYFFWDTIWGHKKLQILLGALLTPMFFLQFYIINGMGGYMLTPGFAEAQASQWSGTAGILGWDMRAYYNPSLLMLTLHRTAANFAYGGFLAAAACGWWSYRFRRPEMREMCESGGRIVFTVAFISLLTLPVIGFFYAWVLKYHAKEAYDNLMIGRGDVVIFGVDWWWVKHLIVAAMLGMGLAFFRKRARAGQDPFLPMSLVYAVAAFYLLFYVGMGMQMTWLFCWATLAVAAGAWVWSSRLMDAHQGSARGVFVLMGVLSFITVMLGGYVREAARPRFLAPDGTRTAGFNRIPAYDKVYRPEERAASISLRMLREPPAYVATMPKRGETVVPSEFTPADLISRRCVSCHTLERIRRYKHKDWDRVVGRMRAYGARLSEEETPRVVEHLERGEAY